MLNFIIVGGKPTGVELAGAIAKLFHFGIQKDFRHFDPAKANIILIQEVLRLLSIFSDSISRDSQKLLEDIEVKALLDSKVEKIDDEGVIVNGHRI